MTSSLQFGTRRNRRKHSRIIFSNNLVTRRVVSMRARAYWYPLSSQTGTRTRRYPQSWLTNKQHPLDHHHTFLRPETAEIGKYWTNFKESTTYTRHKKIHSTLCHLQPPSGDENRFSSKGTGTKSRFPGIHFAHTNNWQTKERRRTRSGRRSSGPRDPTTRTRKSSTDFGSLPFSCTRMSGTPNTRSGR